MSSCWSSECPHVDESDWNGCDSAFRGLTGCCAPGLEQEHDVWTHRRAGVCCSLRRCGGLGTADADWRASLGPCPCDGSYGGGAALIPQRLSIRRKTLKPQRSQRATKDSIQSPSRCGEAFGIRRARCGEAFGIGGGLVPADQSFAADLLGRRVEAFRGYVAPPVHPFRAGASDRRC
jgi:hypothetical protein